MIPPSAGQAIPRNAGCRCPACNPLHGSGGMGASKRRQMGPTSCLLCADTRQVPRERAEAYLAALRGAGSSRSVRSTTLLPDKPKMQPWLSGKY